MRVEAKSSAAALAAMLFWLCRMDAYLTVLVMLCVIAHEAAHFVAALFLNVRVHAVGVNLLGAYVKRDVARNGTHEAIISAAGPIVNLCLALLTTGPLANWNAIMFVINIVPLPGTDGSRMLNALISSWGMPGEFGSVRPTLQW